jgi:hypothetical protein
MRQPTQTISFFVVLSGSLAGAPGCEEDAPPSQPRVDAHADAAGQADAAVPIDASLIDASLDGAGDAAPLICPAAIVTGQACSRQGQVCAQALGCCVCGGFAGVCDAVWVCAIPSENDPGCPAVIPDRLAACSLASSSRCSYCSGGMPYQVQCLAAAGWRECERTGAQKCWDLELAGASCE